MLLQLFYESHAFKNVFLSLTTLFSVSSYLQTLSVPPRFFLGHDQLVIVIDHGVHLLLAVGLLHVEHVAETECYCAKAEAHHVLVLQKSFKME